MKTVLLTLLKAIQETYLEEIFKFVCSFIQHIICSFESLNVEYLRLESV